MSAIAEVAHVTLFIGDFASIADGKVTAVGAGWQVVQGVPMPDGNWSLPPHAVAAIVELPQSHAGEQVALTLTLRNAAGTPVLLPAPEGAQAQPLRMAQLMVVEKPAIPSIFLPSEVPARLVMLVTIPPGLPISLNETYQWTLHIDDETRPDWRASFYLVGAPAGPVLG